MPDTPSAAPVEPPARPGPHPRHPAHRPARRRGVPVRRRVLVRPQPDRPGAWHRRRRARRPGQRPVPGRRSRARSSAASPRRWAPCLASDQYISIVLPGRMFRSEYQRRRLDSKNLSRTIEDPGTITSVLIPWNTCGAFMAQTLGVSTLTYAPFAFFNLINPLVAALYRLRADRHRAAGSGRGTISEGHARAPAHCGVRIEARSARRAVGRVLPRARSKTPAAFDRRSIPRGRHSCSVVHAHPRFSVHLCNLLKM